MSISFENGTRGFDNANYLLIELANIVGGLPLSLDVHGVVLNTFRRRHD